MAKNTSAFEVVQKIKEELNSLMAKQNVGENVPKQSEEQQSPSAEAPIKANNSSSFDIFQRLHTEGLKKISPRGGSPMSRSKFLESQEMGECVFSPTVGDRSCELAQTRKKRVNITRIEDALLDDAKNRKTYKLEIERSVNSF